MVIKFHKKWLLSGLAGLALGIAANAQSPTPIFTKNAVLRLPVQLDERSKAEVAEIKLYVKGPTGGWECVQSTPPTHGAFDYRAPSDGEYFFTFVTVDRRGNSQPRNVETVIPHRVVIVDTTPPTITAEARPSKGETFLQVQVQDASPDWTSLRAMYISPDKSWQPLMVASAETPTLFRVPTAAVFQNKIQLTIADKAGNRTTREIDMANSKPASPTPSVASPLDKGRPDPALFPKDADPLLPPAPAIPEVRGVGATDLPKAPKADMPPLPDLPAIKSPDLPAMKSPDLPPDIKMPDDHTSPRLPDVPMITPPVDPPTKRMPDIRPPSDTPKIPEIPELEPPTAVKPPTDLVPAARNTSSLKPADPYAAPKSDTRIAEEKSRGAHPVLNTRTVSINYALDGGARLASRIDFWATSDAGRTWTKLEDSSRGISPAKLTLPGDGVFGIRIRPGGGSRSPEPGEDPDCVVEVDTTSPAVNLLPPTIGADEGTVVLTWTAADTNLLSNSINLYYAAKLDGPWNVIVSGYKNEGVYKWTLPAGLNGPVYLRLEAMDRAGNVGRVESTTPVTLEVGKQRVKVIGVGPGQ